MNKNYLKSSYWYWYDPYFALKVYRDYHGMTICEYRGWLEWIDKNLKSIFKTKNYFNNK